MKILFISDSTLPSTSANSINVMKMCNAFAEIGHEVMLLAPSFKDAEVSEENIFTFYNVPESFQVKKLSAPKVFGKGAALIAYGILCKKFLKKNEFDLVYGRFLPGCVFSAELGFPTAYEAHVPPRHGKFAKLLDKLFRRFIVAPGFKKTVAISQALADKISEDYKIENIIVAHDAADPVLACSLEMHSRIDVHGFNVGYIGHLYPGKGMELISDLTRDCGWINFHIIGGQADQVEFWKEHLKERKNVKFYGHLPYAEAELYRSAMDVLIAPYQKEVFVHGGGENVSPWMSPLKIFEYMSAKKPIVCSNLPVLREVLEDQKTALLCEPDSLEEWFEAICKLEKDLELQATLGENAYQEFLNNYTWSARAKKILDSINV